MWDSETGFTIIELAVALAIIPIIGMASTMTAFQILKGTERSNNHTTAIRQVQNAGYWISYDTQMAENVLTDNLSGTDFIVFTWTERDYVNDDVYHSVTYSFEELSDGIGKLMRYHWSSAGESQEILVAEHISYDPDDPVNTSNVSYQKPVLTVKLTSLFGDARETRYYTINRRQNFN